MQIMYFFHNHKPQSELGMIVCQLTDTAVKEFLKRYLVLVCRWSVVVCSNSVSIYIMTCVYVSCVKFVIQFLIVLTKFNFDTRLTLRVYQIPVA